MFKQTLLAALAVTTVMAISPTQARADGGIGFGFYFGTPGVVAPHPGYHRGWHRPRRAYVHPRVVRRHVRRQGCHIRGFNQRGHRYIVRAGCGYRGVPVRFVYNARNGHLIHVRSRGRW